MSKKKRASCFLLFFIAKNVVKKTVSRGGLRQILQGDSAILMTPNGGVSE